LPTDLVYHIELQENRLIKVKDNIGNNACIYENANPIYSGHRFGLLFFLSFKQQIAKKKNGEYYIQPLFSTFIFH